MQTLPSTLAFVNPIHPFSVGVARPAPRHPRAPRGGLVVGGRLYKGGQFLPLSAWPAAESAPTRVAIHGFTYTAREVPAGECGSVAFEMHRIDTNHTYHVIRDGFGEVSCSCPDFEFRRAGTGRPCKHGRSLIDLGLIPAPSPLPAPCRDFAPALVESPAPRGRRFEPSPEEMAEAAQLFGDMAAVRASYHRELAASL